MKPRQIAFHSIRAAALLLLLVAGGCVTFETKEDLVQQEEQQRALQQTIDRLKVQAESMLAQQDQLQQQIQQMRTAPQDKVTTAEFQQLQGQMQTRIADLERKIAALDAARAQDKQEIIDRLSKNMTALMAQNAANTRAYSPGRSTTGGGTKSGGTKPAAGGAQKMFEHVVAAGDTLSAIATAYHTSTTAIIGANDLKNPQNLKVGQKLLIPAQ